MEPIKERPILFKTEMVKAILDDRKTQTRRVVKIPENGRIKPGTVVYSNGVISICFDQSGCAEWKTLKSPYGKIGDRLWVKETYCQGVITEADTIDGYSEGCYVSQCPDENDIIMKEYCIRRRITTEDVIWKPSIFMFRKYSRILLTITDIRVERVQDISDKDILAEGVKIRMKDGIVLIDLASDITGFLPKRDFHSVAYSTSEILRAFMGQLWNSINAKPKPVMSGKKIVSYISYPWDEIRETREHRGLKWIVYGNPHIWAVTFKVLKKEV